MDSEISFILASRSPRRLALLRGLGIEPQVLPPDLVEQNLAHESPPESALRLAATKARHVAEGLAPGPGSRLVLGADTVVEVEGQSLGKPRDAAEAQQMLQRLSGRTHQVHTGIALLALPDAREATGVATSHVRFAPLSEQEIHWYVATGEGQDKAGAYAVQGLAALFIEAVEGSPSNVVGLPIELLYRTAGELGVDLKLLIGKARD